MNIFKHLADFVHVWGIVFIVSTTLVLLLKREIDHRAEPPTVADEPEALDSDLGVVDAYRLLWKIIRLKPVVQLVCLLLTAKVSRAVVRKRNKY